MLPEVGARKGRRFQRPSGTVKPHEMAGSRCGISQLQATGHWLAPDRRAAHAHAQHDLPSYHCAGPMPIASDMSPHISHFEA